MKYVHDSPTCHRHNAKVMHRCQYSDLNPVDEGNLHKKCMRPLLRRLQASCVKVNNLKPYQV